MSESSRLQRCSDCTSVEATRSTQFCDDETSWNALQVDSIPLPFLCASVHLQGGEFSCDLGVESEGEGWQQGRQAQLPNWGVEVVFGVNITKPSADCRPPLRIPKLHLLQRMVLCLCARMHVFFTCVRGFVRTIRGSILPEIHGLDEGMKNVLKNSTRKTE